MHPAIDNLRTNQRQLDADGCEVGVSRQALDETLAILDGLLEALNAIDALEVMEINPSNYDHEIVCELSNNAVQAALIARAAIANAEAAPPAAFICPRCGADCRPNGDPHLGTCEGPPRAAPPPWGMQG